MKRSSITNGDPLLEAYGESGEIGPGEGRTLDGIPWRFLLADRYSGLPPITLALKEDHLASWLAAGLMDSLGIPIAFCSRYHRDRWDELSAEWQLPYVRLRNGMPDFLNHFEAIDGVRRFVDLFEFASRPLGLTRFDTAIAHLREPGRRYLLEALAGPILPDVLPAPSYGALLLQHAESNRTDQ